MSETTQTTFAQDVEAVAVEKGEQIEAIVIGGFGWRGGYGEDRIVAPQEARLGEVLTWDEAKPMLNYAYYAGYGAPECHAIYAYTPNWILFVSQYDGSTHVHAIPRSPRADVEVEMPGG